ncbi:hypothetical protein C8F01DRAFT_1370180 [Mycena amicta]|nr:hypothetical protein C8F01DRAFT_1370180 [Mycena amicta]
MSAENCSKKSPFLHVLDSNGPPLDSDAPNIRDLKVSSPQIGDPGDPATSLTQGRSDLADDMLPQVMKLPPELLCDIFRLSLPDAYLDGSKYAAPPWTLGQICRLWRMTAVGYSFLWSFITIRTPLPAVGRTASTIVAALECQLSRSIVTKLSIHIYCSDYYALEPALIAVLLPTSTRWEFLRFSEIQSRDGLSWVASLQGNLRSLEALELLNCGQVHVPDVFSQNVPRLRIAKLFERGFEDSSPPVNLPFSQLTHYRAARTWQEHAAELSHAHNLEVCVLGFGDIGENLRAVHLPHLHTLHLEDTGFLSCLSTPSLENLAVFSNRHDTTVQTLDDVMPFLQRSGVAHRLRRLALLELVMPRNQVAELLRGLPALEGLALELTRSIPRTTLELLIIADSDASNPTAILCPKLTSLTYGFDESADDLASLELIPAIARSRAKFQSQKFKLFIYEWKSDSANVVLTGTTAASFRGLADDGVELVCVASTDTRVFNERLG